MYHYGPIMRKNMQVWNNTGRRRFGQRREKNLHPPPLCRCKKNQPSFSMEKNPTPQKKLYFHSTQTFHPPRPVLWMLPYWHCHNLCLNLQSTLSWAELYLMPWRFSAAHWYMALSLSWTSLMVSTLFWMKMRALSSGSIFSGTINVLLRYQLYNTDGMPIAIQRHVRVDPMSICWSSREIVKNGEATTVTRLCSQFYYFVPITINIYVIVCINLLHMCMYIQRRRYFINNKVASARAVFL